MKKYLIVGFPDESSIEVIPSLWLVSDDICYWPCGIEGNALNSMIIRCVPPKETWSQVHMKIYGGSSSFAKASSKRENCQYTSSISSDSSEDDSLAKKRPAKLPLRFRDELGEPDESQSLLENCINVPKKGKQSSQPKKYILPKHPDFQNELEVPYESQSLLENSAEASRDKKTDLLVKSSQQKKYILPKHPENNPKNRIENSEKENPPILRSVPFTPKSNVITSKSGESQKDEQWSSFSEFLCAETSREETALDKILKLLEEIKYENALLRKEMKKLRTAVELRVQEGPEVSAAISGISSTEAFNNLPLESITELQDLEKQITNDASTATSLARFLCRGGGFSNWSSLTLLIMKRLLKRSLAMKYSFEGKQQKLKFSDLNLLNVIIASVRMKYDNIDVAAINTRIGKVLAGAADWEGNREKRRRKQIQIEDEM